MHSLKWLGLLVTSSVSLLALRTSGLAGDDPGVISITAFAPAIVDDSEKPPAVHHLFGGQTVDLPLLIRGRSEKPLYVRARLVQLAFSLGAPVAESFEIVSGQVFSGHEPLAVTMSLPLPEVRDEADFELRFRARSAGEAWRDAGRARMRLYSGKILDALKPLSEAVVLRLKDDDDKLRSLLESLDVTVVDHRTPVLSTGTPIVTVIVSTGDVVDTSELQVLERESVVVFYERVRTLPKVVKVPWQKGHLIQVELEVLRNLDRDPRVQRAFIDIIELAYPRQERGEAE